MPIILINQQQSLDYYQAMDIMQPVHKALALKWFCFCAGIVLTLIAYFVYKHFKSKSLSIFYAQLVQA